MANKISGLRTKLTIFALVKLHTPGFPESNKYKFILKNSKVSIGFFEVGSPEEGCFGSDVIGTRSDLQARSEQELPIGAQLLISCM